MSATELQHRLDLVFGGLHPPSEAPAWKPTAEQVFRGGDEPTMEDGSSEGAESEDGHDNLGREFHTGMGIDLAREDYTDEDGFLASRAFIRQIDTEAEADMHDQLAVEYGAEQRPSPRTQVLQGNIYDERLAFREALALEDQLAEHMEEDAGPSSTSPTSPRPPISLRSSLRRQRTSGIKKRVSFTGVPELARPWVPPHRRSGFLSKLTAHPSIQETLIGAQQDTRRGYVRYDLEEPLIIGGGIAQLETANEDDRRALADALSIVVASTSGEVAERRLEENEMERWQGAVGGGIEFRSPKANLSSDTKQHTGEGSMGARRMPSFEWEEGSDVGEEDFADEFNGGGGEKRQKRRQYRPRH